jgi:hypothetical protein
VAVTELLSPSSITIGSESFLYVEKLVQSLHIWCDAPESMTHFGASAAVVAAGAEGVSHKESQSPVIARAAVAVDVFTFLHSFIHL